MTTCGSRLGGTVSAGNGFVRKFTWADAGLPVKLRDKLNGMDIKQPAERSWKALGAERCCNQAGASVSLPCRSWHGNS